MTSGSPASGGHSDSPFIVGLAGFTAVIVSSGLAVGQAAAPLGGLTLRLERALGARYDVQRHGDRDRRDAARPGRRGGSRRPVAYAGQDLGCTWAARSAGATGDAHFSTGATGPHFNR